MKHYLLLLYIGIITLSLSCKTEIAKEKESEKTSSPSYEYKEGIKVFDTFPAFEYLLHKQDDTLHVVNFWATWCKPCVAELPYFERLHKEAAGKKIKVTLVSLDDKRKLESKVIPFVKKKQLQSELVLLDDSDYNAWIDKVSPEWSGAIPATYIYKGKKSIFKEQEFDFESLNALVESFE